jgi:hypothetical protein
MDAADCSVGASVVVLVSAGARFVVDGLDDNIDGDSDSDDGCSDGLTVVAAGAMVGRGASAKRLSRSCTTPLLTKISHLCRHVRSLFV